MRTIALIIAIAACGKSDNKKPAAPPAPALVGAHWCAKPKPGGKLPVMCAATRGDCEHSVATFSQWLEPCERIDTVYCFEGPESAVCRLTADDCEKHRATIAYEGRSGAKSCVEVTSKIEKPPGYGEGR